MYDAEFLQDMAALQCHKHKLEVAPMRAEAELGTGKVVKSREQALISPTTDAALAARQRRGGASGVDSDQFRAFDEFDEDSD